MHSSDITALEKLIQIAWDFVMTRLYHPKAHMIYDCLTKETAEASTEDYPTPEEITASSPNPCGWGTGMEDATLSLGSMIDAMIARYSLTREPEIERQLQLLYTGLVKNATAAAPGFIARCVCASDGKSVYIDSSRDQYTNWVYAAHRLLHSELIDGAQKDVLRQILVDVAKKLEYFRPWRKTYAAYHGLWYGKSYYVPNLWVDKPMFKWTRNMAEAVIIQSVCPGYKIPEWEKDIFFTFIDETDFADSKNYSPVLFCNAWWLAKAAGQLP